MAPMMPIDRRSKELAAMLCHKPADASGEKCFQSKSTRNPHCHQKGKCVIEEKSSQQLNYIFASISTDTFVKSCPGSGKTEVIGLKSAYEMARWSGFPGGIAVLTFTRNAAEVIEKRIRQFMEGKSVGFPHYIGTIDSWLHGYIAHPFAHKLTRYPGLGSDKSVRLIDSSSQADFLNAYKVKSRIYREPRPRANQYFYDAESQRYIFSSGNLPLDLLRNSIQLNDQEILHLKETKNMFFSSGFATYQDIENICYDLLADSWISTQLAKRFPLLIIDECQDLSWIQLQILLKLKEKEAVLHFVGDLSQAIYEFKEVRPEKIKEFVERHNFTAQELSTNYRSVQKICDVFSRIVEDSIQQISALSSCCEKPVIYFEYEKSKPHELPARFERYLDTVGFQKSESVILARAYATIFKLRPAPLDVAKTNPGLLATTVYLWGKGDTESLKGALSCLGKYVAKKCFPSSPCSKADYYRPEEVPSAVQWRRFLAQIAIDCANDADIGNLAQTWKTWASAAQGKITTFVNTHRKTIGIQSELQCEGRLQKPKGLNGNVADNVSDRLVIPSAIRIQTIHSVKGEEFDAVMLVSSPTNKGEGHWKQWLKTRHDEAARFAYVASSRPRHLLVWAIPAPLGPKDRQELEELGFVKA